ncbi:MAG: hypothetical protein DME91_02190 [Verrucomicrobia bacterium]|nr:MAG: hypothetical protein DME91_02190 [Verrucomicrobiota bacterium]PYK64709.1 MAG: hypothetical protein DME50_12110 [Verrucomicrobiota bacterium]PYL34291.1 MAG: hypothetical protein DMF38_08805 [Verrucomicrobiota bacterium]HMC25132.1 hypothetical protein [Candidatus Udaeobacter sp.]
MKTGWVFCQNYVYAAWLILHLLLIVWVSCLGTLQAVAQGPTILPSSFRKFAKKTEGAASIALGRQLPGSNPLRETLATYLHVAGIETGYSYFAPNVPGTYKLVFELHYPDGRVEYELPSVSSEAAGLRIVGLLDNIGRTRYDTVREILVKTVAQSIWQEHPDVKTMRAILGSLSLPTVSDFEAGRRESYEFLYAYDFTVQNEPAKAKDR